MCRPCGTWTLTATATQRFRAGLSSFVSLRETSSFAGRPLIETAGPKLITRPSDRCAKN